MVVTAEYDRWSSADGVRTRDRLDVLALEASGRLVVVEIKRADSGSDVHLQAITYAALVSRFTTETLAEAHQHYRAHRGEPPHRPPTASPSTPAILTRTCCAARGSC